MGERKRMSCVIRKVRPGDMDGVVYIESVCFPAAEAAGRCDLIQRAKTFPDSFFVAMEDGVLVGFVNGAVTDRRVIEDVMFQDPALHKPDGAYQSIFGLDVLYEYRRRGIGAALMGRLIEEAKSVGRRGMILTCKDRLIPYYERFGYENLGVSQSVHGGAVWYDMILEFN